MRQNREFEKNAAYRRRLALLIALVLHLAAFAAVAYQGQVSEIFPDFIKNIFAEKPEVPKA